MAKRFLRRDEVVLQSDGFRGESQQRHGIQPPTLQIRRLLYKLSHSCPTKKMFHREIMTFFFFWGEGVGGVNY